MKHSYQTSAAFVLGVVALDALSIGLILPVLPDLVAQVSHASPSLTSFYVGGLFGVYALMQFLFSPFIGGLSDRFGRRPVLLICLLALGLNALAWVWAANIGLLFALRITAGIFGSSVTTASAYIGDVTPKDERAKYFGLVGAMFGIGFILGPIIGGLLSQFGIRIPFLIAACLIGCNTLYGYFMLPESLPPEKRRPFEWQRSNPFGSLKAITGRSSDDLRLIFAWCCLWLTIGAHQASFILFVEVQFGWSSLQNGLALGFGSIFQAMAMALLVPWLTKRWGDLRTALLGLVFLSAAYLIFAFSYSPWVLCVGLVVLAIGTIPMPTVQALLSIDAGAEHQGEVQGALTSLQGLMLVVGPVVMSSLFSLATQPGQTVFFPGAPFIAAALIAIAAFLVLRGLRQPDATRRKIEASDQLEEKQA